MTDLARKKNLETSNIKVNEDQEYIEIFLNYLKNEYDYDSVSLYTFQSPFESCQLNILDDAINSISNMANSFDKYKKLILEYFDTIKIVKLTRIYEFHEDSYYLIISTQCNVNEYTINLSSRFNDFGILNFKNVDDEKFIYSFEDFMIYLNFKINRVSKLCQFESVFIANSKINNKPPFLIYNHKTNFHLPVCYNRKAQIIVKSTKINEIETLLDLTLNLNKTVIKHCSCIINSADLNIQTLIERFIFPLNESIILLNEWNIYPQLTYDFMNVDYSNFWDLKMMVQI
jgi:hypothetical protein